PLLLIVAGACAGALLLPVTRVAVTRVRRAARARRAARRRLRADATVERRARAMMSELCPYGWHAQITLLEGAIDPDGIESRPPARPRVALDWAELSAETGRPVVMRRVWAGSIGAALEAMVADRRTDETLEQIEQGADADGARWPDL
ncbi:MAG: hypothetical protein DLM64_11840, partial [Solirubrobacterales bacterium]